MSAKENEKNQEENLIDIVEILNDYFRIFRRMLVWILLLTIVCSVLFYVRARMHYVPYYTASSTSAEIYGFGNIYNQYTGRSEWGKYDPDHIFL